MMAISVRILRLAEKRISEIRAEKIRMPRMISSISVSLAWAIICCRFSADTSRESAIFSDALSSIRFRRYQV